MWDTIPAERGEEETESAFIPDVTVAQFEALLDYIDER